MRVLNAIQRIIMYALLVPAVLIIAKVILEAFDARRQNPIVRTIYDGADYFILEPFTDVFPNQSDLQTAAVALAAYGLLVLAVVALFRTLRSLASSRPPSRPPAARHKDTAPAKPAARSASEAPASTSADVPDKSGESAGASGSDGDTSKTQATS
ncbi:MAG TPA: hypothetical protein VM307_05095 [Egibacteraceae bacterium]|nr:hypothetical protein [Egibacteraceae bacterium]